MGGSSSAQDGGSPADRAPAAQYLGSLPTPVLVIDTEYRVRYVNDAAATMAGRSAGDCVGERCYDLLRTDQCNTARCACRRAMEAGEAVTEETWACPAGQKIPIRYSGAPLVGAGGQIEGAVEYVLDTTEIERAKEQIRRQQEDLLELSTPVVKVREKVLALPLIGTLDSRRAQLVLESTLTQLAQERARVVIVDITGVPTMDTMVADHIIRMARAIALMGGHCVMTGISPQTANTIVNLGIDLGSIVTRATLAQGLAVADELVASGAGH